MDPNTDERNLETELDYNKVEAEKTKHKPNTKKTNEKYRHTKPKLGKLNIRKPGTLGNT